MEPRPSLDPTMQAFLSAASHAVGQPEIYRAAIEALLDGLMRAPRELRAILIALNKRGVVQDLNAAMTSLAAYLTSEDDVEEAAAEPVSSVTTPKTSTPKPERKVATPGVADDLAKDTPKSVTVDGVTAPVTNWRGVFVSLTEAVIDAGKLAEIDPRWLRDDAANPKHKAALKGGLWLYTNLNRDEQVERTRVLTQVLGKTVSVKVADAEGNLRDVDL